MRRISGRRADKSLFAVKISRHLEKLGLDAIFSVDMPETRSTATAHAISVIVNGLATLTVARMLSQLVAEQKLADGRIATAVNGDFVPAARRATTELKPGDRIEIVSARQGG